MGGCSSVQFRCVISMHPAHQNAGAAPHGRATPTVEGGVAFRHVIATRQMPAAAACIKEAWRRCMLACAASAPRVREHAPLPGAAGRCTTLRRTQRRAQAG